MLARDMVWGNEKEYEVSHLDKLIKINSSENNTKNGIKNKVKEN